MILACCARRPWQSDAFFPQSLPSVNVTTFDFTLYPTQAASHSETLPKVPRNFVLPQLPFHCGASRSQAPGGQERKKSVVFPRSRKNGGGKVLKVLTLAFGRLFIPWLHAISLQVSFPMKACVPTSEDRARRSAANHMCVPRAPNTAASVSSMMMSSSVRTLMEKPAVKITGHRSHRAFYGQILRGGGWQRFSRVRRGVWIKTRREERGESRRKGGQGEGVQRREGKGGIMHSRGTMIAAFVGAGLLISCQADVCGKKSGDTWEGACKGGEPNGEGTYTHASGVCFPARVLCSPHLSSRGWICS